MICAAIANGSRALGQQLLTNIDDDSSSSSNQINLPKCLSEAELANELSNRLTIEEQKLVVNPLMITPKMSFWASQLTAQATNDVEKSWLIFEALAHRQQKVGPPSTDVPRTAQDVFAEWGNPHVSFSCRDNALLYEALARAVGILCFDVYVQESADGSVVPHDCALIIIDRHGILVDPSYLCYGIRHKKFTVMDDLQVIALYMTQLPDLSSSKIAVKLAPELSLIMENYFEKLLNLGHLAEARRILPKVERLDTNAAMTAYEEGSLAVAEGRIDFAVSSLSKAIAGDPHEGVYYFRLANAYAQDSRFYEAREALKAALRCDLMAHEAAEVEQLISNTNALAVWGATSHGSAMMVRGNLPEAIKSFRQAVEIEPNSTDLFPMLGVLYFDCHEYQDALISLRHASKAEPSDPYLRFYIWLVRMRLGDKIDATQELRKYLDGRRFQFQDDWPSKIGCFLVGQISDSELFQTANKLNPDRVGEDCCEAFFYAGEKALISGDNASAEADFKKCIATTAEDQSEYSGAKAELQLLDK